MTVDIVRSILGKPKSLARLWVIAAIAYAYFVGGYLNNSMANAISLMTVAMVEDRSVIIDKYRFDDRDLSTRDGHYYSGISPGVSVLLVPVYLVEKFVLLFVPDSFEQEIGAFITKKTSEKYETIFESPKRFSVALLLVMGVWLLAIPGAIFIGIGFSRLLPLVMEGEERFRILLCAFLMFGTSLASFSTTLYHTTAASVFVWVVFVRLVLTYGLRLSAIDMFWLGLATALVPAMDYPHASHAIILSFAFLFMRPSGDRKRSAMWFMLGFGLSISVLMLYHVVAFGGPFITSYQMRATERIAWMFQATTEHWIWSFLPTRRKIMRAFTHPDINLFIHNPTLCFGIIAAAYLFFKTSVSRLRWMWGVAFLIMFANLGFFLSLPMRTNPSGGSFGARYTLVSVPFGLLAISQCLLWAHARLSRYFVLSLMFIAAIPTWAYLFYGSPRRSAADYLDLFVRTGPANYTLTKAFEARWINQPFISYACLMVLFGFCTWIWFADFSFRDHKLKNL